nr:MAG TPA: hypothetical protein [Caudoviricetes sp.]
MFRAFNNALILGGLAFIAVVLPVLANYSMI